MASQIYVNQSTTLVQVDTYKFNYPNNAIVYLSSINSPGALITIRDGYGLASTNRGIIVSTTNGLNFLDGPSCNAYTINQPFGFLTVTPRTTNIWAVVNTFAFPEQSAAANVNIINANLVTFSTSYTNNVFISTATTSTLYANYADINILNVNYASFSTITISNSFISSATTSTLYANYADINNLFTNSTFASSVNAFEVYASSMFVNGIPVFTVLRSGVGSAEPE